MVNYLKLGAIPVILSVTGFLVGSDSAPAQFVATANLEKQATVLEAPQAPIVVETTQTPQATPTPEIAPTNPPNSGTPVKTSGGNSGIAILERIKFCESGGNYQAQNRSSTASGAYQFLDSSWGGYGGYSRAMYAPPGVQDQKARETYARSGTRPWAASQACWSR